MLEKTQDPDTGRILAVAQREIDGIGENDDRPVTGINWLHWASFWQKLPKETREGYARDFLPRLRACFTDVSTGGHPEEPADIETPPDDDPETIKAIIAGFLEASGSATTPATPATTSDRTISGLTSSPEASRCADPPHRGRGKFGESARARADEPNNLQLSEADLEVLIPAKKRVQYRR